MANPTTNFGWVMPTSTSLVTNLPADFNTFGQAVDTSMSELLGGTTGQVLSKTSNTNMDFTWVTPTDQTPLTTKGDLFTFSTVDARLAVGTNGQTLVANSSTSTGLEWQTPTSGGMTLISTTSLTGSSITLSSIPGTYTTLQLIVTSFAPSASARLRVAPNANTTSSDNTVLEYAGGGTQTTQGYQGYIRTYNTASTSGSGQFVWTFPLYANAASRKSATYSAGFLDGGGGNRTEGGFVKYEVGTITSLVLTPDTGTFSSGTAYLYGVK